jgi:hypothetical protein
LAQQEQPFIRGMRMQVQYRVNAPPVNHSFAYPQSRANGRLEPRLLERRLC